VVGKGVSFSSVAFLGFSTPPASYSPQAVAGTEIKDDYFSRTINRKLACMPPTKNRPNKLSSVSAAWMGSSA
jgi:hypothetical protein